MNQTFEQRIQSIENELKELRKELEESLARYKVVDAIGKCYPFTNGDIGNIPETKCMWDSIPVEDRMKPMGLSCPCSNMPSTC